MNRNAIAVKAGRTVDDEEGDRGDDQQGAAVERELRSRGPRLDVAPSVPPQEIDEERDRDEERDLRDQEQRRERDVEVEQDDHGRDRGDDQEASERRVHVREHQAVV